MSARQNKKQRKGRNNVHQRERTVTTLTEDPNTHYLVPTPSEEPAGSNHMPLSFNNPKIHNAQMGPSFQTGANYPYGTYAPFNPKQQQQPLYGPSQQQPPHHQPQPTQQQSQVVKPTLPPGKNDLDILQNLKKIIKDGQHPFFRAVPQPAVLARLYMGTIPSQAQARGETLGESAEGQPAIGTTGPASVSDPGRRQPPRRPRSTLQGTSNFQSNQHGDTPSANKLVTNLNLGSHKITKNNSGPDLTTPTSVTSTPEASASDLQPRHDYSARSAVMGERTAHDDFLYEKKAGTPDLPPNGKSSVYDAKDDPSCPGKGPSDDNSGMHVDDRRLAATIDDRRGPLLHASDYAPPNRAPRDSRPNSVDSRPQPDSLPQPDSRGVPGSSQGESVGSEHPSHYGDHLGSYLRRPKVYKDRVGGPSFDGPSRPGDRGPSGFGAPLGNGPPMPGSGGQDPLRTFHTNSPPPDYRGPKLLSSPPGVTHRHPLRGPPPGRLMGREDRGSYRAEYDPRRPDVLDDSMVRYGDRSYRDFSPPGGTPRGGGGGGRPPFPPSPGRAPPGGDVSSGRGEWQYHQYSASSGVPESWDAEEGWDRSGDRDKFERDVPPRSWDYRGERDFIARDDYDNRSYAPGPSRDTDRSRPGPYTPPYGRVRPRSPSPMRRSGPGPMEDSRPAMKRPREDFPPSGYYSPHPHPPARDGPGPMRRPPGEYPPPPPPRSGSSGPPPSSASSWPPPPASGGSSAASLPGDRDRDYRRDFPPPAGYDRPRSPGRHSYGRGGGGGGYGRGDPRDRGGYRH